MSAKSPSLRRQSRQGSKSETLWTFEVARPEGRVWMQSTEVFSSPDLASLALCGYLAMTPETAGSFIGRVVPANQQDITELLDEIIYSPE